MKRLRYRERDRSRRSKGTVLDEEYNVSRRGGKAWDVRREWPDEVVPAEVREGTLERREGEARSFGRIWKGFEKNIVLGRLTSL